MPARVPGSHNPGRRACWYNRSADLPGAVVADLAAFLQAATTTLNASDSLSTLIAQSPPSHLSKEAQLKWATNFVSALFILFAHEKATSTAPATPSSPSQNSKQPFDYEGTTDAGFEDTNIFESPYYASSTNKKNKSMVDPPNPPKTT